MSAFSDLVIDRQAVAAALQEMGVDLSGSSAAAMVLAATDMLLALELAAMLPEHASFEMAIGQLASFNRPISNPLPAKIVQVQRLVLEQALAESPKGHLSEARVARLRLRLDQMGGEDPPHPLETPAGSRG